MPDKEDNPQEDIFPTNLYAITYYGDHKQWSFNVLGTEEFANDWIADGLEVHQVVNTIPASLPNCISVDVWCEIQDGKKK